MTAFNKQGGGRGNGYGGGKPSYGGGYNKQSGGSKKPWDNRGDRNPTDRAPQLFSATCDNCGRSCEVPFRPTEGKPVYCKECFAKKRGGDDAPKQPKKEFNTSNSVGPLFENARGNDDVKKQLQTVNVKLDRLIQVLEQFTAQMAGATPKKAKLEAETEGLKEVVATATKKTKKKKAAK